MQGLGQGTILGPLLFLVYVATINGGIRRGKVVDFVDDKTLLYKTQEINLPNFIREDLLVFSETLLAMNLLFNLEKTVFMNFLSQLNFEEISFDDKTIGRVHATKLLGLNITEDLKWKDHVSSVLKKLGKYGFAIRKLKHILKEEHLRSMYFALIHSIIKYAIMF